MPSLLVCTLAPRLYLTHASFLETLGSQQPGSGEEQAFRFYSSCMDTDAIEAAGAGPLRQVIEEVRHRHHFSGQRMFRAAFPPPPRG